MSRSFGLRCDPFFIFSFAIELSEHSGNCSLFPELFSKQLSMISKFDQLSHECGLSDSSDTVMYTGSFCNVILHSAIGKAKDSLCPFSPEIRNFFAIYGCFDTPDVERSAWAVHLSQKAQSSADGKHHRYPKLQVVSFGSAILTLAATDVSEVDQGWLRALPAPDHAELHCCHTSVYRHVNARSLVAEVFEAIGRPEESIAWSQVSQETPHVFTSPTCHRLCRPV